MHFNPCILCHSIIIANLTPWSVILVFISIDWTNFLWKRPLHDFVSFRFWLIRNKILPLHRFLNVSELKVTERQIFSPQTTAYRQNNLAMQENGNFSQKKLSNYLVVPNNLLLSLIGAPSLIPTLNTLSYAREDRRATLNRQRTQQDSLCLFDYVFCYLAKKQNKIVFIY